MATNSSTTKKTEQPLVNILQPPMNNTQPNLPPITLQKPVSNINPNLGTDTLAGPAIPPIIRDAAGNVTGINRGGNVLLGLNPQDVNLMAQNDLINKGGLPATQQFETGALAQQKQEAISQNADLLGGIGQTNPTEATNPVGVDWAGVGGAATRSLIPSAIKGVGVGAGVLAAGGIIGGIVGAPVTGGLSLAATIAGIATLAGLVWAAGDSAYDSQKTETKQQQTKVLSDGKSILRNLVTTTKADPLNADKYIDSYNRQVTKIQEAYSQMKEDARHDPLKYRNNKAEMQAFENFLGEGGALSVLNSKLSLATMGKDPDPTGQLALQMAIESQNE